MPEVVMDLARIRHLEEIERKALSLYEAWSQEPPDNHPREATDEFCLWIHSFQE